MILWPFFFKIKKLKLFKHLNLKDLLNIDNPYFKCIVGRTYPPELQLNKTNVSDAKAPVLDLH